MRGSRFFVIVWMCVFVCGVIVMAGCGVGIYVPDQGQFEDIEFLTTNGTAVARLYIGPVPIVGLLGSHSVFMIKPADSDNFTRWEGYYLSTAPHGYMRTSYPADIYAVRNNLYVMAELTGAEAEPVVEFIENQSPNYPARHCFRLLSGPNSNTYIQWVLDSTAWNVQMPPTSVGVESYPQCEQ